MRLIFDYTSPEYLNTPMVIIGSFFIFIQIYFDFSGYSDMAIGMDQMFGFRFNENFNYPYTAKTLTEFWQRWHIYLSTWFRDYLYTPILKRTNKTEPVRLITIFVVFFLIGLWHGASGNFLLLGVWYATILVLERILKINKLMKSKIVSGIYLVITMSYVGMVFRVHDTHQAIIMTKKLFIFDFSLNPYIVTNLARMVIDYKLMLVVIVGFLFTGFVQRYMVNFYSKLIKYETIYLSILFIYAYYY